MKLELPQQRFLLVDPPVQFVSLVKQADVTVLQILENCSSLSIGMFAFQLA